VAKRSKGKAERFAEMYGAGTVKPGMDSAIRDMNEQIQETEFEIAEADLISTLEAEAESPFKQVVEEAIAEVSTGDVRIARDSGGYITITPARTSKAPRVSPQPAKRQAVTAYVVTKAPRRPKRPTGVVCDLCGYRTSYIGEPPKTCRGCEKPFDQPAKIIPSAPVEGRVSNLVQLRWYCTSCYSKGIVWVKRRNGNLDYKKHCPECDGPKHKVAASRVHPTGSCSEEIWDNVRPPKAPKAKKRRHQCQQCGFKTSYLIRPVKKCISCGYVHEVENVQS